MASTFDWTQNTGLGDDTGFQPVVPTAETRSTNIFDDIQNVTTAASPPAERSQQISLGEAIGGAIVLVGAAWLAGEILGEIFGPNVDLTAVEKQILASA